MIQNNGTEPAATQQRNGKTMIMALVGGRSGGMIDCKLLLGGTLLPSFKAHTFLTFVHRLALVVVTIVAATAIEDVVGVVVVCDML